MNNLYEKIAAAAPVNRQAAMSSARGEAWQPVMKLQNYFPDQPPMQAKPRQHHGFVDYTGQTFGRLTVLGLMKADGVRARWVCRCQCGGYCTLKSKTIREIEAHPYASMCGLCDYNQRLRKGWQPPVKHLPQVKP